MIDEVQTSPEKAPRTVDNLRRIADLIDCPAEALEAGVGVPRDLSEMHELIGLWEAIRDPDARRQVLDLARKLARS